MPRIIINEPRPPWPGLGSLRNPAAVRAAGSGAGCSVGGHSLRARVIRPEHHGRGQSPGHAYRRELYEQIVEELLAEASLGAGAIAGVVDQVSKAAPAPDRSVLDRIVNERERAMVRYLRDRDAAGLERTMVRLDQEQSAAEHRDPTEAIPADVAVLYVRDLPETWRKAEGGSGRQLLASALFDRIDVLGVQEATVHLSARAVRHGLATALPAEMGILVNGRGERSCADTFQLIVRIVGGNVPTYVRRAGEGA